VAGEIARYRSPRVEWNIRRHLGTVIGRLLVALLRTRDLLELCQELPQGPYFPAALQVAAGPRHGAGQPLAMAGRLRHLVLENSWLHLAVVHRRQVSIERTGIQNGRFRETTAQQRSAQLQL
jgi:hypothetical protein